MNYILKPLFTPTNTSPFSLDDVSEEASKEKEVAVEKLCDVYVKEKWVSTFSFSLPFLCPHYFINIDSNTFIETYH